MARRPLSRRDRGHRPSWSGAAAPGNLGVDRAVRRPPGATRWRPGRVVAVPPTDIPSPGGRPGRAPIRAVRTDSAAVGRRIGAAARVVKRSRPQPLPRRFAPDSHSLRTKHNHFAHRTARPVTSPAAENRQASTDSREARHRMSRLPLPAQLCVGLVWLLPRARTRPAQSAARLISESQDGRATTPGLSRSPS